MSKSKVQWVSVLVTYNDCYACPPKEVPSVSATYQCGKCDSSYFTRRGIFSKRWKWITSERNSVRTVEYVE